MTELSWATYRAFAVSALIIGVVVSISIATSDVLMKAKTDAVCLERIIERRYPIDSQWIVGLPERSIFRTQVEAIAWLSLEELYDPESRKRASPCPSDKIGEGHVLQQLRGLSLARKVNPDKFVFMSSVAYLALINQYTAFDRGHYRCLKAVEFGVNMLSPTWTDPDLVEIKPAIGSMKLYGSKSCVGKRRRVF